LASDIGTSDNVNLAYSAIDGFTSLAAFTIANVESLKITTTDADAVAQAFLIVTPITAAAATTVTVSGNMGVSLIGGMTQTALTSLDASGLTATGAFGGLTWTSGALAASSMIKGSAAGTNTVIFSAANTASTFVTYTGGTGDDAVTGSNGLNNVVTLGNGTNSFTSTTAGNNTVTGGTGIDTIIVGTGSNTINLGGGTTANSVTVGAAAGLNVISGLSTGVDTIVLGAVQAAAGYYTSVTGMTAGDKIDFAAAIPVGAVARADSALGAKITLGSAAAFANYLDAATATVIADAGASTMAWFQLNGNTYVVVDRETGAGVDGTTFQDGVDSVIELVGLVSLATSATVGDVLTLA
jgi:S-layer protein